MRLTSLLLVPALSSLNHLAHAFPLNPPALRKQPAVQKRVAYSVVAVDGGSAVTPPAVPVPDVLTLIQTSDSIETVTAPASSTPLSIETIVAIKTVSELEPAKTVDIIITQNVTKTPSPTAIPSYIVVNPADTPTSTSSVPLIRQTFTSAPTSLPSSTLTLSSTSTWSSIPTVSMPLSSSNWAAEAAHGAEAKHSGAKASEDTPAIQPPPSPPAITSSSTLPTASTKTYDDGRWHTSYPAWNATSTALSSASATAVGTGRAEILWMDEGMTHVSVQK